MLNFNLPDPGSHEVSLAPGVIILVLDDTFGHYRLWQVLSCCHGAQNQESLIELRSLTKWPGIDTEGERHATTWVPERLLRGTQRFATRGLVLPDSRGLDDLRSQVALACQDGNWNAGEYMRGMANGLICGLSTLTGDQAEYLEAPPSYLESSNT